MQPMALWPRRRETRVVLSLRWMLLVLGSTVTLLLRHSATDVITVLLLTAVALFASVPLPVRWRVVSSYEPLAEAVLASSVMLLIEPLPEGLLPYLMAPALAAGLTGGVRMAVTVSGMSALVLLLGGAFGTETDSRSAYLSVTSRWTLIPLALGLIGTWIGRLLLERETRTEDVAYASAYRLISQLRLVARQLSGGLDPVSLAQQMLEEIRSTIPFDRGAVYVRSSGTRLSPVSVVGAARLDWDLDDPALGEAWTTGAPVLLTRAFSTDLSGNSAVMPLRIGSRTFGLVAVERAGQAYSDAELESCSIVLQEQGLRLETALLFSEVRDLATAEERRRLAREIHDGIAQELASMGYAVDDLTARARFLPELETDLKHLRSELTRVISELRLSIFDLRSEVHSSVGLGTALSDYVRQVGAASDLTVHLVLDESPTRLPISAEAELLRIAQEAVTNARKHANARNLWVTCRSYPPTAYLAVEDDGDGLGRPREDSFGLEVMRERAERIGATLSVATRPQGGTAVHVTLDPVRTRH